MTPEEIAEDQNLDITAIKAALIQGSSKYRKACRMEDDSNEGLDFSSDQLRVVNRELFDLAMSCEDPNLRGKLLMYIRDDKKGRREVRQVLSNNNTFNILQFNQSLRQAKEQMKGLIDIPA